MKVLLLLAFLLCSSEIFAQWPTQPCGFDLFTNVNSSKVDEFESRIAKELHNRNSISNISHPQIVFIIPVVIHVIHNGGAENITEAQILSQLLVLNEDFRKLPGTNGDGNGVDTKIEFCLARISPDDKCTNGIVRVKSALTNHQTYQRNFLKELSFWNPGKYLNIYVVNTINGGILGYSSFPSGPADADGVVVRDDVFGTIGTVGAANNLGRTLTHEIAHWFGLYHTFQNGCGIDVCEDGDKVCDTPPVNDPNYGCPTSVNSCNNDFPDVLDQVQNYTDYTNGQCKSMFTLGQRDRMHATLSTVRQNIWSEDNLLQTGCLPDYTPPSFCPVVSDFTVFKANICEGSDVQFTNRSLNNPTNHFWRFKGGNPAFSTDENPIVFYSEEGIYEVTLDVWNNNSRDSLTKMKYIIVSEPDVGDSLGINEGFENLGFPWSGISINNPDKMVTWERTTLASYAGQAAVRINNLVNTNYGQNDELILPGYDFTTYSEVPILRFKWAYAQSSSTYSDELTVLVSKDCGLIWNQVFYRSGRGLATSSPTTEEYIPDSNTVWKSANINLSTYISETNVLLKIVNTTDGGNCLYLDNINLGDTSLVWEESKVIQSERRIEFYPNPVLNQLTINSTFEINGYLLHVYSTDGKEVMKLELKKKKLNVISFNVDLAKGLYFVVVQKGDEVYKRKIILR